MKVLLLGKNGQVGWELNRSLIALGEIIALDRTQADFSKLKELREIVAQVKPDVIVNAVAYTAVDKAESEAGLAEIINAKAPAVLAQEALKLNALLIHYSTDYVFDGSKDSPYNETDKPCPINVYGQTKLAGEQAIASSGCDYLIFRTSWVYASRGHNFLLSILKLISEKEELGIVSDQIGSPTSARLIAEITSLCINSAIKEKKSATFTSQVFHLTSSNYTSWYGFTEEIISLVKEKTDIKIKLKSLNAIITKEYPTPAKRPINSRLVLDKLEMTYALKVPDWKDVLSLCVEELK